MEKHDLEWFLDRLEGVEGSGDRWTAYCPCHNDYGSSLKGLSISQDAGTVLIKCHSPHCGVTLPKVREALESGETTYGQTQETENPWEEDTRRQPLTSGDGLAWWSERTGVSSTTWENLGCVAYKDGVAFTFEGKDVLKIRRPPKEIIWTPKGSDAPPMWPIPGEVLPSHVWVTEGESDCGTAYAAGHYAFAVTKGAGTELPATWAQVFSERGVKEVTICSDWDKSGKEFSRALERQVVDAGLICNTIHLDRILDPFEGGNDLNFLWRYCGGDAAVFNLTLDKATERVMARYPILSYEELERWASTEIDWILTDLISPGDKILISGPQKSYKTWIALDLARSLASGENFLNRAEWSPLKKVKVLFVQEEGSKSAWAKRTTKMGLQGEDKNNFLTFHRQGIKFTDTSTMDTLIAVCREEDVQVIFFDPLQRMMPGVNENDSNETGIVWDEIFRLQLALPHLVVIVIHHANKTDRLTWESVRGSSRHAGEVDLGIFCQKHPTESNIIRIAYDGRDIPNYLGTGETFEAKVTIPKDEALETTFKIDASEMQVQIQNLTHQVGAKNRDAILEAVEDGHDTRKRIMGETGLSDSTVRSHLERLTSEKFILEHDNGEGRAKTYTRLGVKDGQ
jgi:DNA-binding transcriptional ArsR family regulator